MTAPRALEGLRIVECGSGVSAAYAAKLFADLGADVVKVESPGGDITRLRGPFPGGIPNRERSGLFCYLNGNKRGVMADLSTAEGQATLGSLLADADALIHNFPPGSRELEAVSPERLRSAFPRLVVADISCFGRTGAYRNYQGTDLIALSAAGLTSICGAEPGRPDQEPLRPFGQQSEFQAGCNAAVALLGALFASSVRGDGDYIDVSAREAFSSILGTAIVSYSYMGLVASRLGTRSIQPWAFMRCEDGLILIFCVENEEWSRLVDVLGNPEWASWEIFSDRFVRGENWDILKPLLETEVAKWRVRDLYETAQQRRIPLAPVSTMADLLASPQLAYTGFFRTQPASPLGDALFPGPPYRLSATPWRLDAPPPKLGEDSPQWKPRQRATPKLGDGASPLAGLRVVDFTWVWAGPYCAMQLAHLGAEVIKVESEKRLDTTRRFQPFAEGEAGVNRSGYFNQYNQGKRSVTINLSDPKGKELARRLADTADVVIDNFAPGAMERLGLDHDTLRTSNPRVITLSLSGFGPTGPESRFVSYGPSQEPLGGLSALSGYVDGPPGDMGLSYGDPNAGIHGAFALLAALRRRDLTGEGQRIDVSLFESSVCVIPEGVISQSLIGFAPPRMGTRDIAMSPHGIFPCAGDDRWVAIAVRDEAEFRAFASVLGKPGLTADPRFRTFQARKANEDDLDAIIRDWTRTRDRFDITRDLQAVGVPTFPCLTIEDLIADPALAERGFFETAEHPEVGVRAHAGVPWRAQRALMVPRGPAPSLGEANGYVLREILALTEAEISDLQAAGVIG